MGSIAIDEHNLLLFYCRYIAVVVTTYIYCSIRKLLPFSLLGTFLRGLGMRREERERDIRRRKREREIEEIEASWELRGRRNFPAPGVKGLPKRGVATSTCP